MMATSPETPQKKLKYDEKGVDTVFDFDVDLSHPPDPHHKFETVHWNQLIVDKTKIKEIFIKELDRRLEKKT